MYAFVNVHADHIHVHLHLNVHADHMHVHVNVPNMTDKCNYYGVCMYSTRLWPMGMQLISYMYRIQGTCTCSLYASIVFSDDA